ncbi:hypothetical protein GGS23DRAFT_459673 [Durotheca rogersii]|uniref:uncharacterized protein n=1 Tax=Durotheca rogersii TaxID=419775 RepID=UPI00221F84E7|nr:uncharacterized protein GGS23DRAFT_459673 [Durotheca rogersii]KAI5864697.1 hypothetical protein GGS23DRAFT_459673 [Durotheca rogersii]
MEPPSKKPRLEQPPGEDDDDEENLDELSMSPTQFDISQDPIYQLDKGRAKAVTRLKSAFETIFEKYERDFTGVGDEIDLETGEVVVDNGHLLSLQDDEERAREGPTSSNGAGKTVGGQDVRSTQGSHSQVSVRADISARNHPQVLPAGPAQPSALGGQHSLPPSGSAPYPFGLPDPFTLGSSFGSLGSPMLGNGPLDPRWQAPQLPMPPQPDRFGFISQGPGYPPSLGPSHWPMPMSGGAYGNGFFGGPSRRKVPQKLSHVNPAKRKILPAAASAGNDSDEDDVLLGDTTKGDVGVPHKEVDAESSPASTATRPEHIDQEEARGDGTSPKPQSRLRRSKKEPVTSNSPACVNDVAKGSDRDTTSTRRIEVIIPAVKSTCSVPNTIPPTVGDIPPLDTSQRRSSRARKQTEFYGQIPRTNRRQPEPEIADASFTTADITGEVLDSLPVQSEAFFEPISPIGDPSQNEGSPLQLETAEYAGSDELTRALSIATQSQVTGDVAPANQWDFEMDEGIQDFLNGTPSLADHTSEYFMGPPPLTSEDPGGPSFSFPSGETNEQNDKLLTNNEPKSYDDMSVEERLLQILGREVRSEQLESPVVNSEGGIAKDFSLVADPGTVPPDTGNNKTPVALEVAQESDARLDDSRAEAQVPPVQMQSDVAHDNLPGVSGEEPHPVEAAPVGSEPGRDITEALSFVGGAVAPIGSPGSERTRPTRKSDSPERSSEQAPAEKPTLPLRPSQVPAQDTISRSPKGDQERNTKTDSLAKRRPSRPPEASTNSIIPKTPNKRRKSHVEEGLNSNSRNRTSPTKKKFTLASLVPDDPDGEDELSVLSPSATPHLFRREHAHTTTTPSPASMPRGAWQRTAPATDLRTWVPARKLGGGGGVQSSPLARTAASRAGRDSPRLGGAATPAQRRRKAGAGATGTGESPARTPGGTARRCGEAGFVCDREFCLTCCK